MIGCTWIKNGVEDEMELPVDLSKNFALWNL
jgi:hypothetical protein